MVGPMASGHLIRFGPINGPLPEHKSSPALCLPFIDLLATHTVTLSCHRENNS